jgi:hypothetical protein
MLTTPHGYYLAFELQMKSADLFYYICRCYNIVAFACYVYTGISSV